MKQLADDVFILDGLPPYAINVYVIGDVLVDAGTRRAGARILRQLRGRDINTHVLTHAHPDHQGPATRSVRRWGSRCGAASAMRTRWRTAGSQSASRRIHSTP